MQFVVSDGKFIDFHIELVDFGDQEISLHLSILVLFRKRVNNRVLLFFNSLVALYVKVCCLES